MTKQEAKELIIKTIVEISGAEEKITEDSLLVKDLGLSSMQLLAMLGELEDIFDVELRVSKINKVKTVGELCDFIIKQA